MFSPQFSLGQVAPRLERCTNSRSPVSVQAKECDCQGHDCVADQGDVADASELALADEFDDVVIEGRCDDSAQESGGERDVDAGALPALDELEQHCVVKVPEIDRDR